MRTTPLIVNLLLGVSAMFVHGCASETSTKEVDDARDHDDDDDDDKRDRDDDDDKRDRDDDKRDRDDDDDDDKRDRDDEDKRDRDDDENKTECPIGTTTYDFWSGEYPGVVVQVDRTATLMAKTNVCDSKPSIQCTISPGLYHPWATQNLGTAFKTISKVNRYRATKPFILEADKGPSPEYKTGTIITENMYLSEGYCVVTVDETMYHWVPCPEADGFELLPNPAEGFETREFIGFKCLEGQVGWFETGPALFQNPGIQTGEITGYGEIGKAGESEFGGI